MVQTWFSRPQVLRGHGGGLVLHAGGDGLARILAHVHCARARVVVLGSALVGLIRLVCDSCGHMWTGV